MRRSSFALSAALMLAASAAAADPGTQPHELDGTNPPENTDAKCRSCHAGGIDDDGKAFRPWDTWAGTMMAQAARDPLFLAALTVAEQDSPGIGTLCWRCHSPQGFVKGNATPALGTMLDDDDREGVACDACHRSLDPSMTMPVIDPKGPYAGNGYLFWDPGLAKRGPYMDADSPAHTTIADSFTSSAKLCGQCHELSNPRVMMKDANGNDTGRPFPLDTTFTEWSSYAAGAGAKTCVECHMRPAAGDLQLSTFASGKTRTKPRTHFFAAANVWGIAAVMAAEPMLASKRILAFGTAWDEAVATLASAVKVEITSAPAMVARGEPLTAAVRVTNLTGHKFPTGYADARRSTLRVELIAFSASLAFGSAIVASIDAHVYEAVHERRTGTTHLEWHIALSDTIAKDTRIPPKGFVPGPTTPILGATYGDGFDETMVVIPFPTSPPSDLSRFVLRASVLYQATLAEMVDALAVANTTDMRGQTLKTVFAATGNAAPISIASAEANVAISPVMMVPNPPKNSGGCSCSQTPSARGNGAWLAIAAAITAYSRRFSSKRARRMAR